MSSGESRLVSIHLRHCLRELSSISGSPNSSYSLWPYVNHRSSPVCSVSRRAMPCSPLDQPPRKVWLVLSLGGWTTVETGERMLEPGKCPQSISLIVRGTVRVSRNEAVLGDLVAGHLVGSALLLTGTPAEADAVAIETVRAVNWEVKTLEPYLSANPEVRIVVQRHVGRDLVGNLPHMPGALPPDANFGLLCV